MKTKLQVRNYIFIFILILLSAININNYFTPKQVLGERIEVEDKDKEFWQEFLTKNPKYLPGYIELGDVKKVKQLDPNFLALP